MRISTRRVPRALEVLAIVFVVAIVAASCGGGGSSKSTSGGSTGSSGSGGDTGGKPTPGGTVTYALEGKTTQFCIPRAQLAISGILVVQAVYDTLTVPTRDPQVYAPYLAKSVTPNADYTQWTIVLRPNITFQDGTPLDANAVKMNIDQWSGGILLSSVFTNATHTTGIASTQVTAPDTVVVNMVVPWVAFPAFLWTTGRAGIAAPTQLSSPNCDTNMIGTGPFKVTSFDPTTGNVSTVKNPNYWRKDADGNQLPYLDGLNFVPQEESQQRINGLQGGQFDVIHSSGFQDLNKTKALGGGIYTVVEPDGRMEISHALPNVTKPPLDDINCRKAVAEGTDRAALSAISQDGEARLTGQVFDTRIMGYVSNPGFPSENKADARKLVAQCKAAHGGTFAFDAQSTFDRSTQALAQELKRQMAQIGVSVNLPAPVDQATIINKAVGGTVDSFLWRNYPGADPDTMYPWFHGGSLVNFNHINDPVMNDALDKGRSEPDPAKRKQYYETFNKRMSSQVYNFWTWYTAWFIGSNAKVHGFVGPNLPDASGAPGSQKAVDIIAGYHQMLGIWKGQ